MAEPNQKFFQYSPLVNMDLGGENHTAPFEVIFRGADETANEDIQMNEFAVASSSTETTDLDNGTSASEILYNMQMQGSRTNSVEEDSPLRETRSDPFNKPRWWREASSLSIITASMIIFCVGITIAMIIQILVGAPQVVPQAGVLSDDDQCSEIGIKVLSESADSTYPTASTIDAAILTSLCLIIKNIHKGGIGGGGFMLIEKQHDASHDIVQIDFREVSPMMTETPNVTRDEIRAEQSVAVPGYIRGMKLAHDKFGKAPWKNIFAQASKLASEGVLVSEEVSEAISTLNLKTIPDELLKLVTKDNDTLTALKTNDTLTQPALANTFQIIGENPDAFYTGTLADSLLAALNKGDSKIQKQDLKNYKAISNTDVLRVKYGDMSVATSSPPSSGPVLLSALNFLSHYPIVNNVSTDYLLYHRMLEALKHSYGYQSSWETNEQVNTSFNDANVLEQIVDNKTFPAVDYLNGTQPLSLNKGGVQHVTVVGYDGFVVTIVMGIGTPFGSKIMSNGFILNNAMLDFCWPDKNEKIDGLKDSEANMIAGGKRPMSSMLAVLGLPSTTKCGLYLGFDAHVAESAISALLQTVVRKVSGMVLPYSISSGRLNQYSYPFNVEAEASVSTDLIGYLKSLGHNVTQLSSQQSIGVCHVLTYFEGIVKFYEDSRDADDGAYVF